MRRSSWTHAVDERVVEGRAVLGDEQRRQRRAVVVGQAAEQRLEAVRGDRPALAGDLALPVRRPGVRRGDVRRRPAGRGDAVLLVAGAEVEAVVVVVVDPQPVDRTGDLRGVAVAHREPWCGDRRQVRDHVVRVSPEQHRVEEQAVERAVDAPQRHLVHGAVARDRRRVEHEADRRRPGRPQRVDGQAVAEQEVVCRRRGVAAGTWRPGACSPAAWPRKATHHGSFSVAHDATRPASAPADIGRVLGEPRRPCRGCAIRRRPRAPAGGPSGTASTDGAISASLQQPDEPPVGLEPGGRRPPTAGRRRRAPRRSRSGTRCSPRSAISATSSAISRRWSHASPATVAVGDRPRHGAEPVPGVLAARPPAIPRSGGWTWPRPRRSRRGTAGCWSSRSWAGGSTPRPRRSTNGGHYPLTAPVTRPRTKNRCKPKNTANGTIIVTNAAAVSRCHSSPRLPAMSTSFTGSGGVLPANT